MLVLSRGWMEERETHRLVHQYIWLKFWSRPRVMLPNQPQFEAMDYSAAFQTVTEVQFHVVSRWLSYELRF